MKNSIGMTTDVQLAASDCEKEKRKRTVTYHLLFNLSRPVSLRFLPTCIKALEMLEEGRINDKVRVMKGMGRKTAGDIIQLFQLGEYVQWAPSIYDRW